MSTDLPRPVPALRVTVIGHTDVQDGGERETAVAEALRDSLTAIRDVAKKIFDEAADLYAAKKPVFRLACCGAPGTDALGATIGGELGYEITYVLPHAQGVYAKRLNRHDPPREPSGDGDVVSPEEKPSGGGHVVSPGEKLEKLLALSATRRIIELDGGVEPPVERDAADLVASRIVVDHSDIIVAVWRGEPAEHERGRRRPSSCTREAIVRAWQRGVPVVWIPHPDVAPTPESTKRVGERHTVVGDGPFAMTEAYRTSLREQLAAFLDPYADVPSEAHAPQDAERKRLREARANQRKRLLGCYAAAHGMLGRVRRRVVSSAPQIALGWIWTKGVIAPLGIWLGAQSSDGRTEAEARGVALNVEDDPLADAYDAAAGRATGLMNAYRGSFIATYLLGAIAVFLATLAYILKAWDKSAEAHEALAKWGMKVATLEFVVIVAVLIIFALAGIQKWHLRSVDCRLLTEMLRHARSMRQLFMTMPRPRPLVHRWGSEPMHWVPWYFHAMMREVDIGACRDLTAQPTGLQVDKDELERRRDHLSASWLLDQAKWHESTARTYHLAESLAQKAGFLLFFLVLFTLGTVVGFGIGKDDPYVLAVLLVFAAAFPAFAAAFHGIASQAQFEKLGQSYERMHEGLDRLQRELEAIEKESLSLHQLRAILGEAAGIMLAEVEDWHVTYRGHPVPLT